MNRLPTFRDAEKISAYLDGQLSEAEARRVAARLKSDPQLAAVAEELRQARLLLRQTPRRRVPRNFLLTPRMAGLKPPVPRAVSFMRFASALAAFLLFVTFAVNIAGPLSVTIAPMGYGGMGGGPTDETLSEPSMQMEAVPAEPLQAVPAPEQRVMATPEAATQALALAPEMTAQPKVAGVEPQEETVEPLNVRQPPIPTPWLIGLAVTAVLSGGGAFVLVSLNDARWRRRLPRQ
jgi:hypothetical protein